jgi:hypothetical protein
MFPDDESDAPGSSGQEASPTGEGKGSPDREECPPSRSQRPGKEGAPGGDPDRSGGEERPPERSINEREVKVLNVFQYEDRSDLTFVLLQDGRGRKLPIFIGQAEALAIYIALQKENRDFHRPLTHDLLKSAIEKLGAKIERLTIDDMWQDTFYARLVLNRGGSWIDIDCRPSDGIAVALRAQAPIYVADEILDSCRLNEE